MRLLLVSATSTVPAGPRQRPPGSDSCADVPVPSASPGLPLPASVLIVLLLGSSTCINADIQRPETMCMLLRCKSVLLLGSSTYITAETQGQMCIQARSGFMQLCLETRCAAYASYN